MRTSNVTYLVKKGVTSVWKNFVMSFASFCILMVSLLQVSCAVLLILNANIVMGNIEDTNEITIFIEEGRSDAQLAHIKSVLENNESLTDVKYYSKEDAYEDFKTSMGDQADLLNYLPENPMPETFLVRVTDISKIKLAADTIANIDGVEKVRAPYDFAVALVNIRNTLSVILTAVLATLVIISIIIVSNTIRTSVYARREEIQIMRYVGATNSFIKTPFFVEGMFIGILAGASSWALTMCIYNSVFSLFQGDVSVWRMFGLFDLISFDSITWLVLAVNCVAGALLGAVGTVISMGKYLKV